METIIKLDGIGIELNNTLPKKAFAGLGMISSEELKQPTELGDSLKELNNDSLQQDTQMSNIDMRTRLHWIEINSILALDTLVALKVLPLRLLNYTRQKKRLNVSQDGLGRKEIVEIVGGKREHDKQAGIGSRIGSFFGMNQETNNQGE